MTNPPLCAALNLCGEDNGVRIAIAAIRNMRYLINTKLLPSDAANHVSCVRDRC